LTAILTSISVIQKRPQLKREYNINPTIFNDKKSKLSPTTLKRRNKNNYTQIIPRSPTAFTQATDVNSCSFIQPLKYAT
jgi:hypothetical protein